MKKRTEAIKTYDQRGSWEHGQPDYTGSDKFDNILAHMKSVILNGDRKKETARVLEANARYMEANTSAESVEK